MSKEGITFSTAPKPARKQRSYKKPLLVAPTEDFSDRRITRSVAKLKGYKPVSAIPLKPKPLRQPKAKRLKISVALDDTAAPADSSPDESSKKVPPPTPLSVMQALGASLRIPPEKLTVEKLMASSKDEANSTSSNDN